MSGLGFVAQSRGDVRHGPNGGVVEPALEADCAECSEAVRDTDAKANLVSQAAPVCGQGSESGTQFKGREHRLERRVLHRHRIGTTMQPSREIIIKYNGTLERYAGDGVMVIFKEDVMALLRVGALGEAGEAA